MTRRVGLFGVDYRQWRALMRAHVLISYADLFGASGAAASMKAARKLILMAVGLGIISVLPAVFVLVAPDAFLAATTTVTMTGVFAAMMTLGQVDTFLLPGDYAIIGFHPVSSRTYQAVRFSAIFLQTCEVTAMTGYLPVVAFLVRPNGSLALSVAAAVAILATNVTVTALLIGGMGALLHFVRPVRVRRLAAYLGPLVGVVWVGGLVVMMMVLADRIVSDAADLSGWVMPAGRWVLAYPGVWFAAYVELAIHPGNPIAGTAAWLSVGALLLAVFLVRGRFSAGYAARVAMAMDATSPVRGAARQWARLRGESRAIAILARYRLFDDPAFYTQVVMGLAMVGFFLYQERSLSMQGDPFVHPGAGQSTIGFFAVFFPLMLHNAIVRSADWEAGWIFTTTPADRRALVVATRNVAATVILLPVMVIITVWSAYIFGSAGHAVLNSIFVASIAYIALQLKTIMAPAVLFTLPAATGGASGFLWQTMVIDLLCVALLFICTGLLYRTSLGTSIGLVALLVLIGSLDRFVIRRLDTARLAKGMP